MLSRFSTRASVRPEHGFTLIETLVAMLSSAIVVGALVLLFEITINQTTRINETSQATQSARIAMTKIVDELHSACLAQGFMPVRETSTPQMLRFAAAFSEKENIPYTAAAEREIAWNKSNEALTEYKYAGISGENGKIKFNESTKETSSGTRIAEKIAPESGKAPAIFRYYRYSTSASSGSEASTQALEEISLKEGEELKTKIAAEGKTAAEVAAVTVTFKTGVYRNELLANETKAKNAVPSELSTQVLFAFAAPNSEAPITAKPCE
jgi:Tfp pilus assembly protein PilW